MIDFEFRFPDIYIQCDLGQKISMEYSSSNNEYVIKVPTIFPHTKTVIVGGTSNRAGNAPPIHERPARFGEEVIWKCCASSPLFPQWGQPIMTPPVEMIWTAETERGKLVMVWEGKQ